MVNSTIHSFIFFVFIAGFIPVCRAQDSTNVENDSSAVHPRQLSDSTKAETLEKFREAFEKVINSQNKNIKQKKSVKKDPTLDLGILVLDETRTKMGRDFYSLFYQDWTPPKDAGNFTITISEQPSPGLGSIVSVKLDYEVVYRSRLQPRYDYIKSVSQQAIARCQKIIQQQSKVRKQLAGY